MPAQRSHRLGQVIRIVALCIPIVAAFAIIVLPIAFALAWFRETSIFDGVNLVPAIVCGLIASLFVLVFHVKKEMAVLPIKNNADFLGACREVLIDLGCDIAKKSESSFIAWPSFRGLLLGGHIHVQTHGNEGYITGPKILIEILRSRLRLQHHIAGVEQNLRDSRVRLQQTGRMLKRVELSFRLKPCQWNEAGDALLKKLVDAGADVCCEVHVLAQNHDGIRESILEGPIRDWLQKKQIQSEIHKDHSCWDMKMSMDPNQDTVVVPSQQ
jgi:hypothetical protein